MKKKINNLVEAAGVPENIHETSVSLYKMILSELKKFKDFIVDDENNLELTIESDLSISDQKINKINLTIIFFDTEKTQKPEIDSMAVSFTTSKLDFYTIKIEDDPSEVFLIIRVAKNPNNSWDEFLEMFANEKNEAIESLSHELMHSYSNFKKRVSSAQERAKYSTYSKLRFGLEPIDKFIFYLYYIAAIENIVRPSEFHSYLRNNNATQKDFIKFMTDYRVFKDLKEIKNFSYVKMIEDLKKDMDKVDKFFERNNIEPDVDTDSGKINQVLELLYINLIGQSADEYRRILVSNFMEEIFGFSGEKDLVFKKFINKLERFGNYENMLRYEEKNFKFIADKMIKKISKVYSLLKKEKEKKSLEEWHSKEYKKIVDLQDILMKKMIY